jgi:hypothetical protein
MSDVIAVIGEMSWWIKGGWLVWLAWLGVQVAWYRWGRLAAAGNAPAVPARLDASRLAPVVTAPHPATDSAHAPLSGHRRRRRSRRAPGFTAGLTDGAEAAR